jgi:hypothetical protein
LETAADVPSAAASTAGLNLRTCTRPEKQRSGDLEPLPHNPVRGTAIYQL